MDVQCVSDTSNAELTAKAGRKPLLNNGDVLVVNAISQGPTEQLNTLIKADLVDVHGVPR